MYHQHKCIHPSSKYNWWMSNDFNFTLCNINLSKQSSIYIQATLIINNYSEVISTKSTLYSIIFHMIPVDDLPWRAQMLPTSLLHPVSLSWWDTTAVQDCACQTGPTSPSGRLSYDPRIQAPPKSQTKHASWKLIDWFHIFKKYEGVMTSWT